MNRELSFDPDPILYVRSHTTRVDYYSIYANLPLRIKVAIRFFDVTDADHRRGGGMGRRRTM